MTATTIPLNPAPSRAARLTGRIRDVAVLTTRNFTHIRREPLSLSDVTVQPVLFTLLFVYVFGSGVTLPGGGSYANFAIAGLLAVNLTTLAIGTAAGLTTDLNSGVIDRFRSLAIWPAAGAGQGCGGGKFLGNGAASRWWSSRLGPYQQGVPRLVFDPARPAGHACG